MGTTVGTAGRNAALDAMLALINGGTGDPTGDLHFTTSSDVACATLPLSNPAFQASVAGTATANTITPDTNAAGGTTTRAQFRNRANVEILRCNVGVSGSDINLTSTVIPPGGTVQVTSVTVTMPAGSTT